MNCKKCGSPLTPESKICNVCGADVEQPVVSNNQSVAENVGVSLLGDAQNNPQQPDTVSSSDNSQNISSEVQTVQSPIGLTQSPIDSVQTPISPENPFLNNQTPVGLVQSPVGLDQDSVSLNQTPDVSVQTSEDNTQDAVNSSIPVNDTQNVDVSVDQNLNTNPTNINNVTNDTLTQQPTSQELNQESVQVSNPVSDTTPNNNVQTDIPSVDNQVQTPVGDTSNNQVSADAKPKKKGKLGLIIVLVLVILIVAYFVFQYISLTSEANKIKNNNNTNNSQLQNNNSKEIVSEDSYEKIAHQDEYYIEYDFDYGNINANYEKEYSIGKHKVNISMNSNKTGSIKINGKSQNINNSLIKIYHLLKSDTLFIESILVTNDSEIYTYTGSSIDNLKSSLTTVRNFDSINISNNVLVFTGKAWEDNKVYNGNSPVNICQDNYTSFMNDTFVVETTYSFALKETAYSSDKLQSTTKKTIKELYSEVCSGTTTTSTRPTSAPTTSMSSTSSTSQVTTTLAIN